MAKNKLDDTTNQSPNDSSITRSQETPQSLKGVNSAEKGGSNSGKKVPTAEELDIKRMKIRYDFWKWFGGSFLIGAFTAISAQIIKSHEATIRNRQVENTYLSPLLQQYMGNADNTTKYNKGRDMATFMALTVDDDDYRKKWQRLYKYCDSMYQLINITNMKVTKSQDSLIKIQNQVKYTLAEHKGKSPNDPEIQALNKRMQEINKQIQATTQLKVYLGKRIDTPTTVIKSLPVVKSVPQQTSVIAKEEYSLIDSATKYISKNYGQTWKNFDISVNSVSPHNETANVSYFMVDKGVYTMFQDNVDLDLKQEAVTFSPDLKYRYNIIITGFGKIGFKSTAYFHVEVYQKN